MEDLLFRLYVVASLLLLAGFILLVNQKLSKRTPPLIEEITWKTWFHPEGTAGRAVYLLSGLLLFNLELSLDILLAKYFQVEWTAFDYIKSVFEYLFPHQITSYPIAFFVVMLAVALPFIWIGLMLTIKRLRSAGLPLWLVILFFLPDVNFVLFILLSGLPPKTAVLPVSDSSHTSKKTLLGKLIPEASSSCILVSTLVTGIGGAFAIMLTIKYSAFYGASLFLGLPFCGGFVSVLLYNYHRRQAFWPCMGVGLLAVALMGVTLLLIASEGILCIVMALPLAFTLGLIGSIVAFLIQDRPRKNGSNETLMVLLALLIAQPTLMGAEYAIQPVPPLIAVQTAIEVDAPPEIVWEHVVAFTELSAPTEWYFKTGIAYPKVATISGTGVGAIRHCTFTTGDFIEPITIWDAPRLLKFDVIAQPAPMKEWSYKEIHPPHLDNYLVSEGGQFLLTPLPNGKTRLEGTTWYRNKMWPVAYWQIWSDGIIHRIHQRVLNHVKSLSEQETLAVQH